ncbi:MAG TPA: hypothetical protein VFE58_03585 [Tepidisphaeraceae bacterium]|jgi:hypothetical protein|nr:hypothetical protein [Tepidisphaeraceae bacterium]
MTTISTPLQFPKLGRKQLAELTSKAKSVGMTPQQYVRLLIEQDLELEHKARTTTLAELVGPGREVDEQELDQLVDRARERHSRRAPRRKK